MLRRLICMFSIAALAAAGTAPSRAASQAPGAGAAAPAAAGSAAPAAGGAAGRPPGTAGSAAGGGQAQAAAAPPPEPVHEALGQNMARYYMVFLRRSGKPLPPSAEARKIMEGHMDNIRRLAGERKLLLAGPFMDQSGPGSLAGIFILSTATAEEAQKLVDSDPAVVAGRFTVEIVPWLGPKTLTRVLEP
jgi:uncharacterized protein YciI